MDERRAAGHSVILVGLAFMAFVSLGLPDGVMGVAWPSVRETFGRPVSHLGILLAGGTIGYLISSFSGGSVVRAIGVGRLLVSSSLLIVLGMLGMAVGPWWWGVVGCAFVGGLGAGAIDGGINTFAAARFSPRVVNWLHACWGIGATGGPLIMTGVIVGGLGWRAGYGILAGVMTLLAVLFAATVRLWDVPASADPHASGATMGEALRSRAVWMQMGCFFLYTGIEVTAGQWLFTVMTEGRGVRVGAAGVMVGTYWAALTVGRVVFGQVAAALAPLSILRAGMTLAPVGAALVWWGMGLWADFVGVAVLGAGLAPAFPTLISVTPARVGVRLAAHSIGFQMAAGTLGVAVWPGIVGVVARRTGLEVVCGYLVLASLALFAWHEATIRGSGGRGGRG